MRRHADRSAGILVFAVAALLLRPFAAAAQQAPTPVPVDEATQAWRARLNSAVKAETSILREVYAVESSEYKNLRELQELEDRVSSIRTRAAAAEEESARLGAELEQHRARIGKGLLAAYKLVNRRAVGRALLRSDSLDVFLRRWRALKFLAREERRRVLAYQARLATLAETRRDAESDLREVGALMSQAEERHRAAASERTSRLALLDAIRQDRALAERTSKELVSAREEAENAIEAYTRPGDRGSGAVAEPPAVDFAARKGYLKRPVTGPIASPFGPVRHERLGTLTRNNGIDILAEEGTPVVAAADGVVRVAGEIKGFGRVVILDHGNRYHTLYGHLQRISCRQGELVMGGQTLGTVGSTGSLAGARLHFEIRSKGTALDPQPWLGK